MAPTEIETDPALAAWRVSSAEYPLAGTRSEQLAFCVRYAVLAPSGHNSQPWAFRLGDNRLELRADRRRALAVVDPDDRELVISCGAALGTLRIAARGFGHEPTVEVLPDPADPDLLATVSLTEAVTPTAEARRLTSLIPARRTTRTAYLDRPLPPAVLADLTTVVPDDAVWLRLVTSAEDKHRLAALVAAGDRQQFADRDFRHELSGWVRANDDPARDGIRGYGFGVSDGLSHMGPFVARIFDMGRRQPQRSETLIVDAPVLAALGTADDDVRSWLAVGEALSRLLLRLADAGATAAFVNQPVEVGGLRASLAHAVGMVGLPQLMLRLGYAPTLPPPEPRRSLTEVLSIED